MLGRFRQFWPPAEWDGFKSMNVNILIHDEDNVLHQCVVCYLLCLVVALLLLCLGCVVFYVSVVQLNVIIHDEENQ